jgi:hypothetical protein
LVQFYFSSTLLTFHLLSQLMGCLSISVLTTVRSTAHVSRAAFLFLSSSLSSCSSSVSEWMRSNRLQLNADKTDIMCCASARRISYLPSAPVSIAGSDVLPVSTVRSLGVLVDSDLGAASHVRLVVSVQVLCRPPSAASTASIRQR